MRQMHTNLNQGEILHGLLCDTCSLLRLEIHTLYVQSTAGTTWRPGKSILSPHSQVIFSSLSPIQMGLIITRLHNVCIPLRTVLPRMKLTANLEPRLIMLTGPGGIWVFRDEYRNNRERKTRSIGWNFDQYPSLPCVGQRSAFYRLPKLL